MCEAHLAVHLHTFRVQHVAQNLRYCTVSAASMLCNTTDQYANQFVVGLMIRLAVVPAHSEQGACSLGMLGLCDRWPNQWQAEFEREAKDKSDSGSCDGVCGTERHPHSSSNCG